MTIESYGYTRNTLTTAKTLGENGELVGALGFCLSAKAQIQKMGSGKIRHRHKFGTPRFLAASFDFTWAVTECDETWASTLKLLVRGSRIVEESIVASLVHRDLWLSRDCRLFRRLRFGFSRAGFVSMTSS